MSAALLAIAFALAASVPLTLFGWAAAAATERLTRDPRIRERAWTTGSVLPVLAVVATAALVGLARPTSGPAPTGAGANLQILTALEVAAAPAVDAPVVELEHLAAALLAAAVAGLVLRLARAVAGARSVARMAARGRPVDVALEPVLQATAARLRTHPAPLRISAEATQPMLAGVFRPVVVAPEALASAPERLALVYAHELEHLRRRDNLRLLGEEAVAGAFWFNPVMPRLLAGLRASREEACDAAVLRAAPPAVRRLYADTLLNALRLRAGPELAPALTGASRRTAMRVQALLHPAPPARLRHRLLAGGLLSALLLAVGGGAAALAQAARDAAPLQRASVHSYTAVITADEPDGPANIAVTVSADRQEETAGGTVATGRVEVQASGAPAGLIEVDGRPQPAGFDPRTLQGRIERVETRDVDDDGGQPVFNLITRPTAGGSAAPRAAAPVITRPNWAERPSGEDVGAAFPAGARIAGISGRATLQCTVAPEGALTGCEVVSEVPADAGFGAATLAIAPKFRMLPASTDGRALESVVRVPVLWQLAADPPPTTGR